MFDQECCITIKIPQGFHLFKYLLDYRTGEDDIEFEFEFDDGEYYSPITHFLFNYMDWSLKLETNWNLELK